MADRLTEAQRRELERIACFDLGAPYSGGGRFSAPVRRLLKRRLVRMEPHPSPKYRSNYILVVCTPAGRRALETGGGE